MIKLNYTIETAYTNAFDIARFNLIWRFNYVLSILLILLNVIFSIQGDFESVAHFTIALGITTGSLIYLFKTQQFRPIYFFISICGILFPAFTMNTVFHILHYGDIVWTIVAITIAYFGLGVKIGKYFVFAGALSISYHIFFTVDTNLANITTLSLIGKTALTVELLVALSIVFYIIYQYTSLYSLSEKKVTDINKELAIQYKLIQQQNSEKEILLKEIHHRVKNNLQIVSSLLNLQSNSLQEKEAIDAIKEGQGRIKTMALLHQKLYQGKDNFSQVNFKEYTSQLITAIESAYSLSSKKKVTVQVEVENLFFDIDTAVPLSLIINELASNAFKYAFPDVGTFYLGINRTPDNSYIMTITDTGPGLVPGFDFNNTKTLGLRLVFILCKQLKGNITYSYSKGTKFVISFMDTTNRKEIS